MRKLIPLFLLLFASVHWVQGQDETDIYYVDGNVEVSGNGEDGSPWKTIAEAVTKAQDESNGVIVINVRPFAYSEPLIRITEQVRLNGSEGVEVQPIADTLFSVATAVGSVIIRDFTFQTDEDNRTGIVVNQADVLTITSNTFQGFATAVRLEETTEANEVNINQNVFRSFSEAISVGTDEAVANLVIRSNDFEVVEGSTVVSNESSPVVNAEYNWWGEGTDIPASVSDDNVDFSPYLNTGNEDSEDGALIGFQGDFSSVTLGSGPSYGTDRNELQEAYNTPNTEKLLLAGSAISEFDTLNTTTNRKPATLIIEEGSIVRIRNIIVDVPDDTLSIDGSLFVDQSIIINDGNLKTVDDNSEVTLGNDVKNILEDQGRLVGRFTVAPRETGTDNFGILGLSISKGSSDIGEITLTRITGPKGIVTQEGNQSIAATWIISSTQSPADGAPRTLNFTWHSSFDNIDISNEPGFTDTTAVVWRSSDDGATWQAQSAAIETAFSGSGDTFRRATARNVTEFSAWTVSIINKPLPVTLTDFTARLEESSVRLDWATASEINSDYFGIERSTDGYTYQALACNKAAGDTQIAQSYLYIDEGVANRLTGIVYYRLHMVDFDGSSEYSPVVAVPLEGESPLRVYANHEDGTFKLFGSLPEAAYTVQVSDLLGNIVYEAHLPTQPDVREYALPVPPASAVGVHPALPKQSGDVRTEVSGGVEATGAPCYCHPSAPKLHHSYFVILPRVLFDSREPDYALSIRDRARCCSCRTIDKSAKLVK